MKKYIYLILIISLCLALCACGAAEPSATAAPAVMPETVTVHAQVPGDWAAPGCWAWSAAEGKDVFEAWPGEKMAFSDGWYTVTVPSWIDSVIINGNAGTVQTADLSVESGKDLWVVVENPDTAVVLYEDPANTQESPASEVVPEKITVHAQVPVNWASPGCWAWSAAEGKDVFEAWPGVKMTVSGGWYTVTVPSWIDSVIINGNAGTVQTADLSVESGKDLWIVVENPDTAVVFYEDPANAPETPGPVSPEKLFSGVGTLTISELTASKALPYVCTVENHEELSRKIDLTLLSDDMRASAADEVRYVVTFAYCATKSLKYTGTLEVYVCSIETEIQDVLSGEVIARETFYGPELPDNIVSDKTKYYGEYPDIAEAERWVEQFIREDLEGKYQEAAVRAQELVDNGALSYNNVLWLLSESDQASFTMEEARYGVENCDADWYAEAVEYALRYVEDYDMAEVETFLNRQEFTPEQIAYALEHCG